MEGINILATKMVSDYGVVSLWWLIIGIIGICIGYIVLMNDVYIDAQLVATANVVLDLNGYTIYCNNDIWNVTNKAWSAISQARARFLGQPRSWQVRGSDACVCYLEPPTQGDLRTPWPCETGPREL